MGKKLSELIDRLIFFEQQGQITTKEDFDDLQKEILGYLSKGHQTRLARLTFFAPEEPYDIPSDIPF